MAVRGVLWDVGNVIVRWEPARLYSKIFPDPAERDRFLTEVCTLDWHSATDRGVSFADNIADLSARHPHHAEAIAAWRGRWDEMFEGGNITETEEAMDALAARGVPQFGLSNMSTETWDGVRARSRAFRHLRDTVISAAERVMKPDPRIYGIAARRAGMAPDEMLFVDDSAANIAAAAKLGFDTHHFTDPAALRPALERRGLL